MKNFEERLSQKSKELPFTPHLDDGQYNEGVIVGFEFGAQWAVKELRKDILAEIMKGDEKDGIYQERKNPTKE
jgi:hypothetical protein